MFLQIEHYYFKASYEADNFKFRLDAFTVRHLQITFSTSLLNLDAGLDNIWATLLSYIALVLSDL